MSPSRRETSRRRPHSNTRVPWLYAVVRDTTAQSEGVAVVLMLAMVLIGTMTVLVVGGVAIGESRQNVQVSQAEHAMRQLDAGTSSVAFEHADRASVDLGVASGDGQLSVTDDGWMRVEIQDASTGYAPENQSRDFHLGTVVYQNGDTTVAYQGGGVWRSDGGATTMLARPEFHYRNGTLTIPVVDITESNSLYEDVEVVESAPFERWYPNATDGRPHKLSNKRIVVTVQSDYYEAWGQYFEDETNGIVSYDHAQKSVSVTFLAVPSTFTFNNGIVATSGTGTFQLHGKGAYTDSYDSRDGPYITENASRNGDVAAVGPVELYGGATLYGDLRGNKTINITGNSTIDGDVYVFDDGGATSCADSDLSSDFNCESDSATLTGDVKHIDGVATVEPIDLYVRDSVEKIRVANDNDDHWDVISADDRINLTSGESGELDAGNYYFTDLTLDRSTLTLDTSGGDIVIAVRDYIELGDKSAIELTDDTGNVTIFVLSQAETKENGPNYVNLLMNKNSSVSVPDDRSPRLRVFGTSDFKASIQGSNASSPSFVGILYAPAGTDGSGWVEVKQAQVFGAVITGSLEIGQGGAVHYDEALGDLVLPRSPGVSRLEYLHVGHHRVEIRET